MNFKLKEENVYQTRKLNATNTFPWFSSKNDSYRRGIPSCASTEFRAKEKDKRKVGYCNLHQLELKIPKQLKENLTAAKASLESFLLNTTN